MVAVRAQRPGAGALAGAAGGYIRGHWPGQVYRLVDEHGVEIHVPRYQPRSTLVLLTLHAFAVEHRAKAGPTGAPPTGPSSSRV